MVIRIPYLNLTYITLFFLIIWDALKVYLSLSSPIVQAVIIIPIVSLGIIDNFNKKLLKNIFSPPCSIWLIWITYVLINTFLFTGFHHHRDQNPFVFISAIFISYFFLLFIVSKKSNTNELIKVLIWAYFVRLLLSFIFDYTAVKGHDTVSRFGVDFNPNLIAFGALFIIILILIKKIRTQKFEKLYLLIMAVSVYTIMVTSSRKVFIALVIVSLGYILSLKSRHFIKNIFKKTVFSILLVIGIFWALSTTSVGERLIDSYVRTIEAEMPEYRFDYRMNQYIKGWKIFKEHPINGVGLSNFMYASNYFTPLHTEYMVQFTECGLVGVSIFIIFYGYIITKLLYYRRKNLYIKELTDIYLLSMLIMFILFFGGWIYNNPMMWVLIALSIRFIKECQLSSLINKHHKKINYNEKYSYSH